MLKLRNINKTYNRGRKDEITVLKDVNADFPRRGMIALCGRSGSGKTSLLNVIGGLISMDSGEMLIDGKKIGDCSEFHAKRTGFVFQNYYLCDKKTVYDNVADSLRLCGETNEDEIKTKVMNVLTNVGILKYANRLPSFLSGGQQQRVAFARAIVKEPDILLADEPTGNLDAQNTQNIMGLLCEYSKKHLVILVTHDRSLVRDYCDGYYSISEGEISEYTENRSLSDNENNDRDNSIEAYTDKKKTGKLFGFWESFKNGVKNSYSKKAGSKVMCRCLLILSVLFVFMAATASEGIRKLIEAKTIEGNNQNVFYGFLANSEKAKEIEKYASEKKYGIDGMAYTGEKNGGDYTAFLNINAIENSMVPDWDRDIVIYCRGTLLPYRMIPKYNKSYGKCEGLEDDEAVITTAMVDQIIYKGTLSYFNDPESLIGFNMHIGSGNFSIAGVIESDEQMLFVTDKTFAASRLGYFPGDVELKSDQGTEQGKVKIVNNKLPEDSEVPHTGDKVVINGVELTVESYKETFFTYDLWLGKAGKPKKATQEEFCAQGDKSVYEYLDYYFEEYTEYLTYCRENRENVYYDDCMELALNGNMYALLYLKSHEAFNFDYPYAVMFYQDNNYYPSEDELNYSKSIYPDIEQILEYVENLDLSGRYGSIIYLVSDEDFILIANSFGVSKGYGITEGDKPSEYVALHSFNPKKTNEFVKSFFTDYDYDYYSYMSPIEELKKERRDIIDDNMSVFLIWGMMGLSVIVFTAMIINSNLLKQKREYGIYRCLGVSKSNLKFRFCVENMATAMMTSGIGSAVTGALIILITKSRYAMALYEIIWYPVIEGILVTVSLILLSVFISWLSLSLFLKHDPGDIMTELEA
ncbi:MAG: ATP-binding cassette domain-containing protein [Lachnospiraceae bacterium]|nr:ATP-binding cassette domain-containing protein [Lachnospiraceae bacterium]